MQNTVSNLLNFFPVKRGEVAKYELFKNESGSEWLLVFDANSELKQHTAPADASILVVYGEVDFRMDDVKMRLHKGDIVTMRKGTPHSVKVLEEARIMLTLLKA